MASDLTRNSFPPLNIPSSIHTVDVRIINTTRISGIPATLFLEPAVNDLHYLDVPSFCFLIEHDVEHDQKERYLFDLGPRRDWDKSAPSSEQVFLHYALFLTTPILRIIMPPQS
jgi:hypothetical protein